MLKISWQDRADVAIALWEHVHTKNGVFNPKGDYEIARVQAELQEEFELAGILLPHRVNRIVGNKSLTRVVCNLCNKEVDKVIRIDPTYGGYSTQVCENCIDKMKGLL